MNEVKICDEIENPLDYSYRARVICRECKLGFLVGSNSEEFKSYYSCPNCGELARCLSFLIYSKPIKEKENGIKIIKLGGKMKPIKIKYNVENDILYVYFSENKPCWSTELGNDVILRVSIKTNEAVSLEVLSFSKTKFKFEIEGK